MSRLIDIGGRRLEVFTSGTKQPSVVFENGAGRPATDWDVVRSLIDPEVGTLAYSRAGQGRSDPPAPQNVIFDDGETLVASAESRTRDLTRLLDVAHVEPPYVLVGHSLGGIFIRLFAAKIPGAVAGMVFVDSSHPDQSARLSKAVRTSDVPDELKAEFLGRESSPNEPVMTAAADTGPFNHVPIAVFSQDPDLPILVSDMAPPAEIQPVWRNEWSALQRDIAKLSTDSTHTVVEGADHLVHLHSPELVAEAISAIIARTRTG